MGYEVLGQANPVLRRLAIPGAMELVRKPVVLSPIFPGGIGPSTSQPAPPTGTAPAASPQPPSDMAPLPDDNGTLSPELLPDVVSTEEGVSAGTIALWLGGGLIIVGGIGYLIYDYMKKQNSPASSPVVPLAHVTPVTIQATQVQNPGMWFGRVCYDGMHDYINYADLVSTIGYDMGGEWASAGGPFGAGADYVEFSFDNNKDAIDFATSAAKALKDSGAKSVKAKVRKHLGR